MDIFVDIYAKDINLYSHPALPTLARARKARKKGVMPVDK
jgi:hypothetical protein